MKNKTSFIFKNIDGKYKFYNPKIMFLNMIFCVIAVFRSTQKSYIGKLVRCDKFNVDDEAIAFPNDEIA